jgi:flavin reductase (DIM6/NTAB) family NADH-FMN oxidoreductase RutF
MTIDTALLRQAFGTFATGVTVVTACDAQGGAHGLTANSFTSVSLDPPLVLWCVGNRSDAFELFCSSPSYAVNILPAGDEARAMRFAGKGDQQIDAREYETGVTGAPLLRGVLASLDCELRQAIPAGDHVILLAEVREVRIGAEADGLTYFRSRFGLAPHPLRQGASAA